MRNDWLHKSTGYMKIQVTHASPETFIKECQRQGVLTWEVTFQEEERFTAYVLLTDLYKLKKMAKLLSCKIKFEEKKGLPFLLKKLSNRKGLVAGILGFIAVLILLSNMVWTIEIEGTDPAMEHEVRHVLEQMGIKKGAFQYFLPAPEIIQDNIMNELDGVTWIGVTKHGSSYHFQVVEKEIVEERPTTGTGHLVASRKAVIHDLFVEKGNPLIKPNQVVKKGDILVSGELGKEGKTTFIAAEGEVIGEFWYKVRVKVPLSQTIETVTGRTAKKHGLKIGNMTVPVWGFSGLNTDEKYKEQISKDWEIFGYKTPFSHVVTHEYELQSIDRERAQKKAVAIAKEEATKKLMQMLSEDAIITGEKVLHETVDGGKVKVSLHYKIQDNIAVKQPIIQGD
ncbi:sporulation protein YqfD [Salipaludibacillus agaradhaerens]|uniref:sporulation protein YqfD n=1 Tax=Salipaludibacillus agaradhaerens TaxID=76935 RepID=UPI000995F9E7|nr:sporulation protein YqfD [Salipaludibacillus agaradhaerens]